jgi:ribosomal protein S17
MKAVNSEQKRRRTEQGTAGPAEGAVRPAHAACDAAVEQHSQIGKVRRDIARVRTLLREKAVNNERTTAKQAYAGRARRQRQDGQKTVTVLVERRVKHPMYDKIMCVRSKYHAHNEGNEAKPATWSKSRNAVRFEDQGVACHQAARKAVAI